MYDPVEVSGFIKTFLGEYGLAKLDCFKVINEDGLEDVRSFMEDGKLVMPLVEKAAFVMGVTVEDLLSMDFDAVTKWQEKFSFYSHLGPFENVVNESFP